jgi:hypothetical protein
LEGQGGQKCDYEEVPFNFFIVLRQTVILNRKFMLKIRVILVVLVLAGASWLTTLVDDGLGIVWTHDVVRNWEQFGFVELHGQLVDNEGGYQADTNPHIYAGHRPASLYPFFLVQLLFHGMGATHIYYALIAGLVFFSIWQLLGRTDRAFLLGGVAVLTPGYLCWQTTIDPNLASVLAGFPFCVAVIWLLRKERLNLIQICLLLVLIILYSAINWSTVFIQGMLFATLLLLPKVPRKNLIIYVILAAVPAVLIVGLSVIDKMTNGHHDSNSGFAKIYRDYGWGNSGYGLDLTTKTAVLRLLCINIAGLLPVIVFLCWEIWRRRTSGSQKTGPFSPLPFLASLFALAVLRNYFGHHPWMSCNYVLLGMVLSLVVWKSTRSMDEPVEQGRLKPVWQWGALGTAFAYGFIVLSFYHVHNDLELNLVKLIRGHTPRSAIILITRNSDPKLFSIQERLPEPFDRHVIVLDKITDAEAGMTNKFWLTAVKQDGYQLVASNDEDGNDGAPLAKQMLGWYSRVIAHRRTGDRMDFDAQYYLYKQ